MPGCNLVDNFAPFERRATGTDRMEQKNGGAGTDNRVPNVAFGQGEPFPLTGVEWVSKRGRAVRDGCIDQSRRAEQQSRPGDPTPQRGTLTTGPVSVTRLDLVCPSHVGNDNANGRTQRNRRRNPQDVCVVKNVSSIIGGAPIAVPPFVFVARVVVRDTQPMRRLAFMHRSPSHRAQAGDRGFTLVELLTVIAIIAILAAIIFPVFGAVQESTRRANTMSNMQKISQAIAAYELDNREYPEYLFGPAISKADGTPFGGAPYYSMRDVASIVNRGAPAGGLPTASIAQRIRRIYSKSLYPVYIRDIETFSSPNNARQTPDLEDGVGAAERYPTYDPSSGAMTRLIPGGKVEMPFYRYDVFDASPVVTDSKGQLHESRLAARYSRAWYPITSTGAPAGGSEPDGANDDVRLAKYRRQLIWRQPPTDTVVTSTSFHAPNGKMVVLWLSGTAKVVDLKKLSKLTDPSGDFKVHELGPID